MNQEIPEENENLEGEEQTGEPTRAKRSRGWPKGKVRKPQVDAGSLASSVDGRQEEGAVYDAEAGELQTSKGKGLKLPPNLPQIGLVALVVSILVVFFVTSFITPMVGKSAYKADITRLETDLVNIRGSNYVAGTSLMGVKSQYDTLNSRSNAFLVQGDLDGYATDGELSAQISSVRSSIPSSTDLANQANTQIATKLAAVDAKLAALGNGTYVTQAELAAAIIYLRSLIGTSTTTVAHSFVNTPTVCGLLIGPGAAGSYTGKIDLAYNVKLSTSLPESQSLFYAPVISTECPTADTACVTAVMAKYVPTLTWNADTFYYLTAVKVTVPVFTLADATTTWWVGLGGLHSFGTPSTVNIVKTP